MLAQHLGLHSQFTPAVADYWKRLQTREGYVRALRAQEAAAIVQGVSTTPAPESVPSR